VGLNSFLAVESEFWTSFAKHFDADGDEKISIVELKGLLEAIGSPATDSEIEELFSRADLNKDNQLSFSEFVQLMSSDFENLKNNPILSKILPENTRDFIFHVCHKLDEYSNSVANIRKLKEI
jgi:hypothetical protein